VSRETRIVLSYEEGKQRRDAPQAEEAIRVKDFSKNDTDDMRYTYTERRSFVGEEKIVK
jgi:hypothetical protein